ncbi:dapper homolog 2 [Acipenser ruthenus]|uniref:dapper homolog 2 n=1 Tax=Acipenser ruthenus TaxID=7906 RepID=UPI0027428405|nr:dapper homolog 2 [Acipenser ruthenus]
MASRKSVLNSPWSGNERVRIGERFQASLAGIIELELLKSKHWERVEAALGRTGNQYGEEGECGAGECGTGGQNDEQLRSRPSLDRLRDGVSTTLDLSQSQDLLDRSSLSSEPLEMDKRSSTHTETDTSDSRPSSGFYSVSDSSLSNSCASVLSEGPGGGSLGTVPPRPRSTDDSATHWPEFRLQPQKQPGEPHPERESRRPVSTGDLELLCGLLSLVTLGPQPPRGVNPPLQTLGLDRRYRSDLISRNTHEVYPYPSPLHAVALQSPLYTEVQQGGPEDLIEDSASTRLAPGPATQIPRIRPLPTNPTPPRANPKPPGGARPSSVGSLAQLGCSGVDRYISQLVLRSRCRPELSTHHKSLSMSSISSSSTSSTVVGGALPSLHSLHSLSSLATAGPGHWKARRRISTCVPAAGVRSPERISSSQLPEGSRNSWVSSRCSPEELSPGSSAVWEEGIPREEEEEEERPPPGLLSQRNFSQSCLVRDPVLHGRSYKRAGSLRWTSLEADRLYQGKHASRELIKASTLSSLNLNRGSCVAEPCLKHAAQGESRDGGERDRDRPPPKPSRPSFWERLEDLVSGSPDRDSPSRDKQAGLHRSGSQQVLDRPGRKKQKWTSVLEIPSHRDCGGERHSGGGRSREEAGTRVSQPDLVSGRLYFGGSGTCLSSPGAQAGEQGGVDPPRLRRAKSFRELRKRMMRPFSLKSHSFKK